MRKLGYDDIKPTLAMSSGCIMDLVSFLETVGFDVGDILSPM